MNPRVEVLKQLVADEFYVIDETAVAEAVVMRSLARCVLPGVSFAGGQRSDAPLSAVRPAPRVKSFRPHRGVPSFRLSRAERRPLHARGDVPLSAG